MTTKRIIRLFFRCLESQINILIITWSYCRVGERARVIWFRSPFRFSFEHLETQSSLRANARLILSTTRSCLNSLYSFSRILRDSWHVSSLLPFGIQIAFLHRRRGRRRGRFAFRTRSSATTEWTSTFVHFWKRTDVRVSIKIDWRTKSLPMRQPFTYQRLITLFYALHPKRLSRFRIDLFPSEMEM